MLTLITYEPNLGVRSPSPFTVKAEALLAMSGLPYQLRHALPRKLPRGKLPILDTDGRLVPDSTHIQTFLENEKGIDFDSGLNADQLASARAIRHMIEHHLYFINLHFRWTEHSEAIKAAFFSAAPTLLRGVIFRQVQRTIIKTLELQGIGRHTREELVDFLRADLSALSSLLGDKEFLMDDVPTSIDASVYGALHNMIDCDLDGPGKQLASKHDNLVAYCERFRKTVFELRKNGE